MVVVNFDCYSSFCEAVVGGEAILEYPTIVIDALDRVFEGKELDFDGIYNPVDVSQRIAFLDFRKLLVSMLKILSDSDYYEYAESGGGIFEYVSDHMREIQDRIDGQATFLTFVENGVYLLW